MNIYICYTSTDRIVEKMLGLSVHYPIPQKEDSIYLKEDGERVKLIVDKVIHDYIDNQVRVWCIKQN